MELNTSVVHTPPRDAATVLLLRDEPQTGLQVFMLRRHSDSAVLGGAYVFPGGKLDEADAQVADVHLDQTPERLQALLAEPALTPQQAKGLYVAALREAFEECGVLLAQREQGLDAAMSAMQAKVKEGLHLTDLVPQFGLQLLTRTMVPFTRWITPKRPSVMNKRFDARFFLAAVPEGQLALHDNVEATESEWLSPKQALHDYWNGRIELAPPQIMSLVHLARYDGVGAAVFRTDRDGAVELDTDGASLHVRTFTGREFSRLARRRLRRTHPPHARRSRPLKRPTAAACPPQRLPLRSAQPSRGARPDGVARASADQLLHELLVAVEAVLVHHEPVEEAVAYRVTTPDGVVVISGDTRVCAEVEHLARRVHTELGPGHPHPTRQKAVLDFFGNVFRVQPDVSALAGRVVAPGRRGGLHGDRVDVGARVRVEVQGLAADEPLSRRRAADRALPQGAAVCLRRAAGPARGGWSRANPSSAADARWPGGRFHPWLRCACRAACRRRRARA